MTEELLALVAERSGIVFAPNRREEAEAGIARAMKQAGSDDLAGYLALVRRDRLALDDLVETLTVGETYFMRDPDQMEMIRREVFPALRGRTPGTGLRVWSAGCATGEEAYSLAILLEEEGLDDGSLVVGTDLSSRALAKARTASYSDWSLRGVSGRFLRSYFHERQGPRILVDRIRDRVRFSRLNLIDREDYAVAGAVGMDLILCRNVLVYFDHATAGRVAARLFECLAPGGVLLTAGADPLLADYAPFEVEVTRVGLVYRRRFSATAGAPRTVLPPPAASAEWRVEADSVSGREESAPSSVPNPPEPPRRREAFERITRHANAEGVAEAERVAQAELRRHPLDAELRYLRATLLLALDREDEAEREAQCAVYLDRSLAVAHFLLGTILRKRGARPDALRAFTNVRDLCAARPPHEELSAGSGERVAALHSAASAEMDRLEVTVG